MKIIRFLYHFLSSVIFLASLLISFGIYLFFMYGENLPDHTYLHDYEPPALSRFYSADAHLLQEHALEKRLFVPFPLIPRLIKEAFLAAEDRRFNEHFGIDLPGTLRSILTNTRLGSWQTHPGGASTITQQVAKNFLIGNQVSMARKIKEAILALRLEYTLPKDRIFELYLNQIYLGSGAYGIAAAALTYFNKELNDLTLEEVAFLAALPKAPSKLPQGKNLERLKQRRDWIIDYLMRTKMISPDQGKAAQQKPISFERPGGKSIKADYFADEARRHLVTILGKDKFFLGGLTVRTTLEPEIQKKAEEALQQGLIVYDRRHGWRGPLDHLEDSIFQELSFVNIASIKEELNTRRSSWLPLLQKHHSQKPHVPGAPSHWQKSLVLHVASTSAWIGLKNGSIAEIQLENCAWALQEGSSSLETVIKPGDLILVSPILVTPASSQDFPQYTLQQVPEVTGGILVIDPLSGRVLALSGGYDYQLSQFNIVTHAYRQAASCFKPFVYLAALEKGFSPETPLLDAPLHLPLGHNKGYYSPRNYTRDYLGTVPLHIGLEQSRNTMTVRLAQQIGMGPICDIAQRFGIMENMPAQYSMVLGAGVTTLWKLTSAYAILANKGVQAKPFLIDWIQDRYGNILYDHRMLKDMNLKKNPFSGETNSRPIATKEDVLTLTQMLVRVTQNGTGRSLKKLGYPIAGKTGTPNAYKDAWFIGFTSNLVVGVFVGFADGRSLGEKESGARAALPIAKLFLEEVYKRREAPSFEDLSSPASITMAESSIADSEEETIIYEDLVL